MTSKPDVFIVGKYEAGAANGIFEFNYQNAHLLKDVFNVHFVLFDHPDEAHCGSELREGIRLHHFGRRSYKAVRLPAAFGHWLATLTRGRAVFHLHNVFILQNFAVANALVRAGLPYLFTPHDSYTPASMVRNGWLKRLFVRTFDRFVLNHAYLVHAITAEGKAAIGQYTNAPVEVVTNLVRDVAPARPAFNNRRGVLFVGRYAVYQKGIDLALRAFAAFKAQGPTDEAYTLLGGATADEHQRVTGLCQAAGLHPSREVLLPGKVPEATRNQHLAGAKVYLQLSRFEGFGLSIVQALSFGTPVIVSDRVPIADVILRYEAGWVVGTPGEAAAALAEVYALPPAAYAQLGGNARRCYEREFSPAVVIPQLIELYQKALDPYPIPAHP